MSLQSSAGSPVDLFRRLDGGELSASLASASVGDGQQSIASNEQSKGFYQSKRRNLPHTRSGAGLPLQTPITPCIIEDNALLARLWGRVGLSAPGAMIYPQRRGGCSALSRIGSIYVFRRRVH